MRYSLGDTVTNRRHQLVVRARYTLTATMSRASGVFCYITSCSRAHNLYVSVPNPTLGAQYSTAQHCTSTTHLDGTYGANVTCVTSATDRTDITGVNQVALLYQECSGSKKCNITLHGTNSPTSSHCRTSHSGRDYPIYTDMGTHLQNGHWPPYTPITFQQGAFHANPFYLPQGAQG